jgi:hypothetical protein
LYAYIPSLVVVVVVVVVVAAAAIRRISVHIPTGDGAGCSIPGRGRFSHLHNIQNGSGAHPASYIMDGA